MTSFVSTISGNIPTCCVRAATVTVQFLEPRAMPRTFALLPLAATGSRYNRFLGAMSELPGTLLDEFIHVSEADRFSVVATMMVDGFETIVGEARYAFHADTASIEFGLSIDDSRQTRASARRF
jgi:hypothetical protein